MMMKHSILFVISLLLIACEASTDNQQVEKPRVIVTCDAELDDSNSLIRYLLYATDFQTEGIIYASSGVHWMGDGKGTTQYKENTEYARAGLGPQTSWRWDEGVNFIDDVVDAYEQVHPNLKVHNPDYPTPEEIRSKVKWGNVVFEGDYSYDSDGSNLIKEVLMDENPAPVFVQVWGGASTVCAALRSLSDQYEKTPQWKTIYDKVCRKMVLCLSGDQNDTYHDYIVKNWPDIPTQQAHGGVILGYGATNHIKEPYRELYEPAWMTEHFLTKGPLGDLYRVWGDGKQMGNDERDFFGFTNDHTQEELEAMGFVVVIPQFQPKGTFLSEGDTFCFLQLVDNGLRAWQDQTWGGWTGRIKHGEVIDPIRVLMTQFGLGKPDEVLPDFSGDIQEDMAARLAWSVTPHYSDANHYPVVNGPLSIDAAPGEKVNLRVKVSDPDDDVLSLGWKQWKVGTYEGDIILENPASAFTSFVVPVDAVAGQTIHLVLEVKDDGVPSMKKYHRTVVTVK